MRSYVDVFSDLEREPTELRMTAEELEASVDPIVLEKYLHEFAGDDLDASDSPEEEDGS